MESKKDGSRRALCPRRVSGGPMPAALPNDWFGPVADGRQRQLTGDLHFNFQHCPATLNGTLQPFNPASPVSASDRKAGVAACEVIARQPTFIGV